MHIRSRRYRNGAAWRLPSKTVTTRDLLREKGAEKKKKIDVLQLLVLLPIVVRNNPPICGHNHAVTPTLRPHSPSVNLWVVVPQSSKQNLPRILPLKPQRRANRSQNENLMVVPCHPRNLIHNVQLSHAMSAEPMATHKQKGVGSEEPRTVPT